MSAKNTRGQSLTEVVISMALLFPIFLGIFYVVKYADIKQAIVQASRYVAFQRVMEPDERKLSEKQIEMKMRAMFFLRDPSHEVNQFSHTESSKISNETEISSNVILWRDLSNTPFISRLDQVRLDGKFKPAPNSAFIVDSGLRSIFKIPIQRIYVPKVEVALRENHLFGPLTISASTAISSDYANAQGSQGVHDAVSLHPVLRSARNVFELLETLINPIIKIFEQRSPELGCIRVDAVPTDRLSTPGLVGDCQ